MVANKLMATAKKAENVKRVLAFDEGGGGGRKRVVVTTPAKKGGAVTPRKRTLGKTRMTPGKVHRMLAPETPTNKVRMMVITMVMMVRMMVIVVMIMVIMITMMVIMITMMVIMIGCEEEV